jgi:hypothetical protein
MSEREDERCAKYVHAVAALTEMPLSPEREKAVAAVMARLADFAADTDALPLGDDVEIPGTFSL